MAILISSDCNYQGNRIDGLPKGVSGGQALTFDQRFEVGAYAITNPWHHAALLPAGGSTVTQIGLSWTLTGTASNPDPSTASDFSTVQRWLVTSAAAAGSLSAIRNGTRRLWRGNAAGRGGFDLKIQFGIPTPQAGMRGFIGISTATSYSNVDPLTNTASSNVGMAINLETGNWNFMHNLAGTAPTVIPLGNNFPVSINSFYELYLSCVGGSADISYRIVNVFTGVFVEGILTTNIPSNTAFFHFAAWLTNNATALAVALAFSQVKIRYK